MAVLEGVVENGDAVSYEQQASDSEIQVQAQTDGNASFLRAARAGNLDKVLEYLKGSIDINTSNANGLNALHLASKEGHVAVVSELLKRGANVNAATKKGNTALHIASLAGQEEVVKILVQNGANVNVQSQNGFTPLYMAAQENHDTVVRFLLVNAANQSLATEDGFTPLAVALQQGHDKVVAVLLENDAKGRVRLPALHIAAKKDDCKAAALLLQNDHNPDVTSKSGFTPLHIAAHYGNENIATILLEKGADVNFAAKHQITPLHVAAKWGKSNMVNLLVQKNAKIDASTRDGLTPLHCAARSGHDQVVDLLLERGAPITAKTKNGLAPLHMASQGDHVDSARILLYHKAPVDDVTVDYLTALHVAAHCGHVRVAKLLLDRKADPNARALNGFTPLHIACKKNRIKVIELLLKHGASIEATTESGLTPLHVASFMGCMNIVIFLIQHGANPDVPTVRGETPLHLAARANQTDIIRILLRNGAHVDARAREEQTPLHIAARLGNVDIVGLLLQHGAAVDATTKDMYTALHIAAKEGQEEVASVLLDHGASLTATTKKGFTPLHLAAKYGNIKVARLLLQKDAPVDAQGKNGVTPLHVAAHYDHVNVALLLLDKGASPHATAKNGYTPLHISAKKNQMDIATTLLEYGAKANAESKAGFTPLHLAAQEGHTDITTLLIDHHADVNSKAKNGLTPLHLCAQEDRVNVAAILVKNSAETDPATKAGYTPLHVACHFGQLNMIRFLLQHGADVNSTNSHGYTPLHQAAQQGHTLIVNLLLEHRASPNATTNQGQTALSIAQRLGYISVVETLKVVTETIVTTTTTTITEEKYRVVAPETMQETFMSDSEDEGGEDTIMGDQSFRYLSADEVKSLGDDSLPIDVTKDERAHDNLGIGRDDIAPLTEEEEHLSPQHAHNYESGFSSHYATDNIDISRAPVHAGKLKWKTFLVSFMVDARGGAMRGCRHSGVRVIIPPRKAAMPMRITCRYLRKEKLIHPPPLMEGEACASRVLEVGPAGAKFLGPVIIEVPHFASLRGKEREITILRSDNGENWREHTLEASEEAVQDVLNESFEGEDLNALDDLNTNRITRILTTDFPQYFAIVTRIRQEVHAIGPEGGMVSSTVVPQVQAIFPEAALTKKIKVGLQAQPISPDLVAKLLGNRVAVSPIVTVEPRRRKFHKPITLTIPVPQAATKGMINQYSGDAPTLRLLCSITGGTTKAQWEDVTGSTPLTFVNDCVSFTTTVSARFWLMDCRQVNEATKYATELYKEAIHVPFMAKFVVFSKRPDPMEAELRVFCMTDDKEDKTLEHQEHFTEVAKSRDVEVLESKTQFLEFAGNLIPVTKSGEQLKLSFQAFRENRLPFTIRVKDPHQDPLGRIAFMREPKVGRGEPPQLPICNLNIVLPEVCKPDGTAVLTSELITLEKKYGFVEETGLAKPELIHRADLRLSDIARELGNDWVPLALQLDIKETDIKAIKAECPDDPTQQALVMLRIWMQRAGTKGTGNNLDKALRKINREDIVNKCMFNVQLFTDEVEKAVAKVRLDQSGFDAFKEELGPSRDASLRRDVSLDVSYDEQDMMKVRPTKEAESAQETSSESGSLHGKDLPDSVEIKSKGEARIIKGLKTPPPSPAERDDKEQSGGGYAPDAVSATRVETREVMDDGSVRKVVTVTKTATIVQEGDGTQDFRDQLVKQLESETWPSAEMDTSQVSVSSLPEDEGTEPTTANLSSTILTDVKSSDRQPEVKTRSDEADKTAPDSQRTTIDEPEEDDGTLSKDEEIKPGLTKMMSSDLESEGKEFVEDLDSTQKKLKSKSSRDQYRMKKAVPQVTFDFASDHSSSTDDDDFRPNVEEICSSRESLVEVGIPEVEEEEEEEEPAPVVETPVKVEPKPSIISETVAAEIVQKSLSPSLKSEPEYSESDTEISQDSIIPVATGSPLRAPPVTQPLKEEPEETEREQTKPEAVETQSGKEWTETDESGGVRHVKQKTTRTSIKIQDGGDGVTGAVKLRKKQERRDSDQLSPEEELSFAEKKNFFQRLSVDSPVPIVQPVTTGTIARTTRSSESDNGEVVEESISFQDRLKKFQKDSSDESETAASDIKTDSKETSPKSKMQTSTTETFTTVTREDQPELWKELDQDIQKAKKTMEIMEKELKEVDVRTTKPGDKEKGDQIARVLVRSTGPEQRIEDFVDISSVSTTHIQTTTKERKDDLELVTQDHHLDLSFVGDEDHAPVSPQKTVGLDEGVHPLTRPSPIEPAYPDEEISPVTDYPRDFAEAKFPVGISPSERDASVDDRSSKSDKDSDDDDKFDTGAGGVAVKSLVEDILTDDSGIEPLLISKTVVSRTLTDSSVPSETSMDSEADASYVERAPAMAFENTAFEGDEDSESIPVESRSPYEVVRKTIVLEEESPASSIDRSSIKDMLADLSPEKIESVSFVNEGFEDVQESTGNIEQCIKSQILSDELDQSLEETLPESKPLSREESEDVLSDIDREVHYAQQIRSVIFTNELEEDIDRGSPERKELVVDNKEKQESSDSDASMVVHPDPAQAAEIQQSPDGLSLTSESFDGGQSYRQGPTDEDDFIVTEVDVPDEETVKPSSATEVMAEHVTWEAPVQSFRDSEDEGISEEVSSLPPEAQVLVEHDESPELSDKSKGEEDQEQEISQMIDLPARLQEGLGEDGKDDTSEEEHDLDENGDEVAQFDAAAEQEEARLMAEKIVENIKTAVSKRPPLTHIPSEISDEDLVEGIEECSFQDLKLLDRDLKSRQYSFSCASGPIAQDMAELAESEGHSLSAKFSESVSSESFLSEQTAKTSLKSDHKSDTDTSEKVLFENVVLRKKKGDKHKDKRSSRDIESYSSSGENESHYQSFETSESTKTPRGSRPTSSEFEVHSGQASEYDTCATSQDASYITAASSQDASFNTARTSVTHSSRESAYSVDSESSGHLASLEISSETSETLVPSAQDLEMDLVMRDVETPTPDETGILMEPYDTEISVDVIRSGVEVPFMRDWEDMGDQSSWKPYQPTEQFKPRRDSESSDSSDSTVDSPTRKQNGLQASEKFENNISKDDSEIIDQPYTFGEDEPLSVSESSITQSTLSTETVIYTTTTSDVQTVPSPSVYTTAQIPTNKIPAWYSQANGPVEVDYIPEYDVSDDFVSEVPSSQFRRNVDIPAREPAPEPTVRISEQSHLFLGEHEGRRHLDSVTADDFSESISSDQDFHDIREIQEIQDDIEFQEVLMKQFENGADDARHSHASLKAAQHPSLPESDLQDDFENQDDANDDSEGFPPPEYPLPVDDQSCLPESEQDALHRGSVEELEPKSKMNDTSPEEDRYDDGATVYSREINENIVLNQNLQIAPFEEEAMEVGSDKGAEEDEVDLPEAPYAYGMQFERDLEDTPSYNDLYTHHEEDEETFEVESSKQTTATSAAINIPVYDTLAGRKLFRRSGEQDDMSNSSLQEFESLEAEIAMGRKSSVGSSSVDSGNERIPARGKSGEHDDVSMNSLTEFEKIERDFADEERKRTEPGDINGQVAAARLSEIEEGHESLVSDTSQEMLSDHGDAHSNDSDDYEKRMSEIDEIIRQAQTNVEHFTMEEISKSPHGPKRHRSGTLSSNESTESSLVDRSPSPKKERELPHEDKDKTIKSGLPHSEPPPTSSALPRHVLAERTTSGHSLESWDSLPKSSASTATQYDTESLRDVDVEDAEGDYSHDKGVNEEDFEEEEDYFDRDSLRDKSQEIDRDSLREKSKERSQEADSLDELKSAMQDSLYQVKDIEEEELCSSETGTSLHSQSGAQSLSKRDADLQSQLAEILGSDRTEAIVIDASKGDCMLSSTDSLEPSSSTATHATYQFETDSIMSSSVNSVQTSGEESATMVSSTDTVEPEPKISYSFSEGESQVTVAERPPISPRRAITTTSASSFTATMSSAESKYDDDLSDVNLQKTLWDTAKEPRDSVEEVRTVDEKGNVVITRKVKRTVVIDPEQTGSSTFETEENIKEFLKKSALNTSTGEEEVEERQSLDESGNVVITRTVKRHVLSEPHIHTQTFTGPDADSQSEEFLKKFDEMPPTEEDLDEFEDTDEHGNVIRVTQQFIVKPEVRTMTFTGPNAQKEIEDFMRSCASDSQQQSRYLFETDENGERATACGTAELASECLRDLETRDQTPRSPRSPSAFAFKPDASFTSTASTDFTAASHPGVQRVSGETEGYSGITTSHQIQGHTDGEGVQVRNDFWIEGGDPSDATASRTVTTRTTTRVFPDGQQQVVTESTHQDDDDLRNSMQNILDQFMTQKQEEKE